jgi:hypothetical protein
VISRYRLPVLAAASRNPVAQPQWRTSPYNGCL